MSHKLKIIVVGAGPAGMMAAIRAGQLGQDVTLIERNPTLGRKLLLSGKGRCNLTNTTDIDSFFLRFSRSGQFLRDAFKHLFYPELMLFFQERGLKLKVERQMRVFPATDSSKSVLIVLEKELKACGVKLMRSCAVKELILEGRRAAGVVLEDNRKLAADRVILATGGVSYAFTGSTGDGIRLAGSCGHDLVKLRPGLVPLVIKEAFVRRLEGLTLKNITVKFSCVKKEVISAVGELLFTRKGISGPLVLSLSGQVLDWFEYEEPVFAEIDLKPALSAEQLDSRILRQIIAAPNKSLKNLLKDFLPQRLAEVFTSLVKIAPSKASNQVTQQERFAIIKLLKNLRLTVVGGEPIEEAMITRGGVSLKQINPRTMESRIISGLYFCGEMIDLDADTGGFNLQAAFSTGYLAGASACNSRDGSQADLELSRKKGQRPIR